MVKSKPKRLSFKIKFNRRSRHWVQVHLHSSRAVMRSIRTRVYKKSDSHNVDACCWQANQPSKDQCVAEIHLGADHLSVSDIAHECSHAAYHRAVLLGIPLDDDSFQEYVATDTGALTDSVMAFLSSQRVKIRYQQVPSQLVP